MPSIEQEMKVTGLKLKKVSKLGFTFTWYKISDVNGYTVEKYNTRTKKFEKVKDVLLSKPSYTEFLPFPGKQYIYRVRAFKKVNGKMIYGEYSDKFVVNN